MKWVLVTLALCGVAACSPADSTAPARIPEKAPALATNVTPDCEKFPGYNFEKMSYEGCLDGVDGHLDGLYNGNSFGAYDHIKISWNDEMDRFLREFGLNPPYTGAEYENIRNGKAPWGSGVWLQAILTWDERCSDVHIPEIVCLDQNFLITRWQFVGADNKHGWVVKPNH